MNSIEQQIRSDFPIEKWSELPILVAVSGGADSVALLRALNNIAQHSGANVQLMVGHVNHHSRGGASNEDAEFVRELSGQLDLPYLESTAYLTGDEDSSPESTSEESLRNFRYHALIKMAGKAGARYIATAHTYDDQVETILFRIFRGTGINGLAGIPQVRLANDAISIVRPMLNVTRDEIEQYLATIAQDFRVDESNLNTAYQRNHLRNVLLPQLKDRFGESVVEAIARLGSQARETSELLQEKADLLAPAIREESNQRVEIDCQKLVGVAPLLVRQWIMNVWSRQNWPRQAMTYEWWEEITRILLSDSKRVKKDLPGNIQIHRLGTLCEFTRRTSE